MDFKGFIKNIELNNNKVKITLETENKTTLPELENLFNSQKEMKVEIKKYRQKRSLDANSYFWSLVDKLSKVLKLGRTEVYCGFIKEGGVYQITPVKDDFLDKWIQIWEEKGDGWFCETFNSKLEGYTNVKNYFGSSVYSSSEMARITDLAIQECHAQGIETLTDKEWESLLESWDKR